MKRIAILLVLAAAMPACATAKAGFGVLQTATQDARVWTDLHGDFKTNTNVTEWAYIDGSGTYTVGVKWVNPLTGLPVLDKVLEGTGAIKTGWHVVWDDTAGKPVLLTAGYDAAHAALGDPPTGTP